jgi:hypothetical protein
MRLIRGVAAAVGTCLAGAAPALVAVAPAAHAVVGQVCDLTEVITYKPSSNLATLRPAGPLVQRDPSSPLRGRLDHRAGHQSVARHLA